MNYEEAVERILQGDPFMTCALCRGKGLSGMKREKSFTDRPGKFTVHDNCETCKGLKRVVKPDYAHACHVLGRPLPPIPFPLRPEFDVGRPVTVDAGGNMVVAEPGSPATVGYVTRVFDGTSAEIELVPDPITPANSKIANRGVSVVVKIEKPETIGREDARRAEELLKSRE